MNAAKGLATRGAVAGALAWIIISAARALGMGGVDDIGGVQVGPVSLVPGLAFGIVVGPAFLASRQLARARLVAYVAASEVAYLLAYHVAFYAVLLTGRDGLDILIAAGVAGGLCGSVVLAFFTMGLLRVAASRLRLSVAVGGIAGALLPLVTMEDVGGVAVGALAFFVLWQSAYAASLAPAMGDATRA